MTSHAISRITFSEIWATTRCAIFSTMSTGTPTSAASEETAGDSGALVGATAANEDSTAGGVTSRGSGARFSGSCALTPAKDPASCRAAGVPGRSACRTQPNPSRTVSGAAADGTDGAAGEPTPSRVRTYPKSSLLDPRCASADSWACGVAAGAAAGSSSKTSSNVASDAEAEADSTLAWARISNGTSTVG